MNREIRCRGNLPSVVSGPADIQTLVGWRHISQHQTSVVVLVWPVHPQPVFGPHVNWWRIAAGQTCQVDILSLLCYQTLLRADCEVGWNWKNKMGSKQLARTSTWNWTSFSGDRVPGLKPELSNKKASLDHCIRLQGTWNLFLLASPKMRIQSNLAIFRTWLIRNPPYFEVKLIPLRLTVTWC